MYPSQTNTNPGGPIEVLAGENLTGKEGYRVVLTHDTGIPEVVLPNDVADVADYILLAGGADGEKVTIEAIQPGKQFRVRLNGTCNPGAELALAPINGTDDGKSCTLSATPDIYYVSVRAEEKGVDEQLVLVRALNNARAVTVT